MPNHRGVFFSDALPPKDILPVFFLLSPSAVSVCTAFSRLPRGGRSILFKSGVPAVPVLRLSVKSVVGRLVSLDGICGRT